MVKTEKAKKINLNFFIKLMIVIIIVFCVINTIRLRTTLPAASRAGIR